MGRVNKNWRSLGKLGEPADNELTVGGRRNFKPTNPENDNGVKNATWKSGDKKKIAFGFSMLPAADKLNNLKPEDLIGGFSKTFVEITISGAAFLSTGAVLAASSIMLY